MRPVITVSNLSKTYASGLQALRNIDLEIRRGEIFALLGPNGAGKTTLISAICGIVRPSAGTILADGAYDSPRVGVGRSTCVKLPDHFPAAEPSFRTPRLPRNRQRRDTLLPRTHQFTR